MNEMFSQGGKGSTGILTNKQAVARHFGVKQSEVVYFSVGALLTGYKVIYDKVSQRAYSLPADIGSGVTAVSLSPAGVLVHSAGNVDLGALAVAREEYVTLPGSFDTGVTVNTKNELVVFTDGKYRWDGALPKEVPEGSTPDSTGEVKLGAWVSVGDASLRSNLSENNGFSLIGGVRGIVKTSEAGSLLAAIDTALANDADVLIDSEQNITTPIRKSLNGKDIKILSTPDGWINFTPTDANTYYQVLTFDGTGVESVTTKVKIDGGKVRGVGRAVVGITVNNVYAHYESSEMRNISACVNTVTAQIHLCYGAKYYNVFQQLASQDWSAGVYGYGTVPIDCETVLVEANTFGLSGQPLDRHAVYCSSQADGTGVVRNAFVCDNTAVMRDYTTETAETTSERCFKFIGTNRVHLHHNTLRGGYGFCLITLHKSQTIESIRIDSNRARTYASGIIIAGQNEASAEPDATWYVDELQMANNHFRMRATVAGTSNGAEWRNTYRVSDVGSSYVNEAFATVNALTVYYPKTDRIRTESFRSESCYYQGFQNITREMAPTYTYIDITCRNAVNTQNPLNASGATVQNVKVRSLDNTAMWKDYTATAIVGFSYYDPSFLKFIRCAGAGLWEDEDGYPVVGLSTGRPTRLREGLKFYQTDLATMITWTGSNWVLQSAGYTGIIKSGTTSQINSVNKALLGYGHVIYNTDTKKPAFFDQLAQSWKYADGSAM